MDIYIYIYIFHIHMDSEFRQGTRRRGHHCRRHRFLKYWTVLSCSHTYFQYSCPVPNTNVLSLFHPHIRPYHPILLQHFFSTTLSTLFFVLRKDTLLEFLLKLLHTLFYMYSLSFLFFIFFLSCLFTFFYESKGSCDL
jgi:hypothetical protein